MPETPELDPRIADKEFFDEAFRSMPEVPADIRRLSERLCRAYGIRGICDPGYIANVIAVELGRGDGRSTFYDENGQNKAKAVKWWRNLSINQMKELEKKHFPHRISGTHDGMILEMWNKEGKPEPQALIPVQS